LLLVQVITIKNRDMKKLILVAITAICSMPAFAQCVSSESYGPKELNCTEEAITLNARIGSGWHLSSFHVGNVAPANMSFEVTPLNIYEIKSISSSPAPLFSHKPAFALNSNYFKNDSLMRLSNIFIFSDTRKVNSSLIFPFYDYRSFLLPQKFGLTD